MTPYLFKMEARTLKRRILFRRVVQGLIVLAIFLMAINNVNEENDFFWQLKTGQIIWTEHYFPTHDIFSHAAYGQIWTLHEWIPSVIFYLIYTYLGVAALIIFKALMISVTFAIFLIIFNKLKVNLYLSLVLLGLAALVNSRGIWAVFPSIFEYFFIAITIFVLEYYKEKRWVPYFLAVLSLIWANSHGSFFLLPVILGSYIVGSYIASKMKEKWSTYIPIGRILTKREMIPFFIVTLISLITPLVTPNGFWTYLYPFRITFGNLTSYVSEYQKFWTVWNWDWGDFVYSCTVFLIGGMLAVFLINIKKLHPTDLLLGLFFGILAITAVRHVAIFALVALYLIAKYLTVWFGEYRGIFARSLFKDIVVILIIFSFVYYFKTMIAPFGLIFSEKGYPTEAADIINQSGIPGNMFNHYNYGGYLIWKMPKYKVFVDGRLEMYEGKAGDDYKTIVGSGKGYRDLIEKYHINFFLNYLTDEINEKLIDDPDWKPVFNDVRFVIFVKNVPENSALINKYWSEDYQNYLRDNLKLMFAKERGDYYNNEGRKAFNRGDAITALGYFQTAVSYNWNSVDYHMNVAVTSWKLGSLEQARQEYGYVLQIDPGNENAKDDLSKLEKEIKNQGGIQIQ